MKSQASTKVLQTGKGSRLTDSSIQPPLTTDQQKGLIVCILADFEGDEMVKFAEHAGFDFRSITDAKELPAAWVAHYWLGQGTYDVDRACMDLATWPPISRRIFELQQQQRESLAK